MPPAPSVKWSKEIEKAAYLHALDIDKRKPPCCRNQQEIDRIHKGKDGSDILTRVLRTKYFDGDYNTKAAGEIIAIRSKNAKDAVEGLLNSPHHCLILMSKSFKHIGAAHVGDYWVIDFGEKTKWQ